jgi:hypothetical protein
LGTTRRTIKEEEEKLLQEKTLGSSFSAKRSSLGLFYVMKVCELKKFQKITCPTFFFSVKKILVGRDCGLVENYLLSFFWHQEKLVKIFSCKKYHKFRRAKRAIKRRIRRRGKIVGKKTR